MIRRVLSSLTDIANETNLNQTPVTSVMLEKKLSWLFEHAPYFPVSSDNVHILDTPTKFYQTFITSCETARERISLASLYLGTGPLERNIIERIRDNVNLKNDRLRVNILLDFTRGSRGVENSRTILLPLLRESNVSLSMYHTPFLRGVYKRLLPDKVNELIGLQHMKIYVFDDTVILSGANLSKDYFTNRQDRYVVIRDRNVSDFYDDLIKCVQGFSLHVDCNNAVRARGQSPYEGRMEKFVARASGDVRAMYAKYMERRLSDSLASKCDTLIFPLVEMGQLNIHNDSVVTKRFLQTRLANSVTYFSTGYFNLTQAYMEALRDVKSSCKILMAHPKANGFNGARGPLGAVPSAYTLLAKNFQRNLPENVDVDFSEYIRAEWTYHAKGLWYYFPNETTPSVTFIGSSNFGERSVQRDVETQAVIVTTNESLKSRLHDECQALWAYSIPAQLDRPVALWVYSVVHLFKDYF